MTKNRLATGVFIYALAVVCAAAVICFAAVVPKHVCFFDQAMGSQNEYPTVEVLTDITKNMQSVKESSEWLPMRVGHSLVDIKSPSKACYKEGHWLRDDGGWKTIWCYAEDVYSIKKKKQLSRLARLALNMHASRLKVKQVKNGFKVPELTTPICNLINVPKSHATEGVKSLDMLLYATSFPTNKKDRFAGGAPCALLPGNNRPVVGALFFSTKHIALSEYNVRVAAHEIAHTLGFSYELMKNKFNMTIKEKPNVRGKPKVTEVQSPTVLKKVREQYGCPRVTGMELEDEAGVLTTPSISHWERRNALEELMAGIVTAGLYTILTLAAFEDTKVYKADFSKAETMNWGRQMPCDFFTSRCIKNGLDASGMFCSSYDTYKKKLIACAPGGRAMGRCSEIVWEKMPSYYQYFFYSLFYHFGSGEERLLTDRCPIFEEHDDLSCAAEKSGARGYKGENSWCLKRDFGTYYKPFSNTDTCANISLKDGKSIEVFAGENVKGALCSTPSQNRRFQFATSVKYDCPSVVEVKETNHIKERISLKLLRKSKK